MTSRVPAPPAGANGEVHTVSVFGLGKLGGPLAVAFAHKGFHVVGVDTNADNVAAINRGVATVQETGLQEMLSGVTDRLEATTDAAAAVMESQASCIIVPTPTGEDGTFLLDHVLAAAGEIGKGIARKQAYHLLAVVSTVMPGDTDRVREAVEFASGKRCGEDFGLCYSPEFIALGNVLRDLLNPDMLLIGASDERAAAIYESVLLRLTDNHPPVLRMNFINAELTKLAVNTYITMKITYANMLARLCEMIPGADAETVTAGVGMDSRIGRKYLTGAVAFGGPCFPRDNLAFVATARRYGAAAPLPEATHRYNLEQTKLVAELIAKHTTGGKRVSVLGLAYKPDTPVIEESPSLALIRQLTQDGYQVTAYDPLAMDNARKVLDPGVVLSSSLEQAVESADLVVIMTAWQPFRELSPSLLRRDGSKVVVIDAWRILDAHLFSGSADLVQLGAGPRPYAMSKEMGPS